MAMSIFKRRPPPLGLLMLILAPLAGANENFNASWLKKQANKCGPDFVQHEKAGPGWFSNLGPTGIRAMMTDKAGKTQMKGVASQFVVKYVFPKSPASRVIKSGDVILGTQGKRFATPYTFGYWFGWGYEGPLTDLGKAVEHAEEQNQKKLDILLLRGGEEKRVTVKLPLSGALSPTFPYDCQKSKKIKEAATKWIIANQDEKGKWPGAVHAHVFSCIALLAQGKKYTKPVQRHLDTMVGKFKNDTWNWQLAMYAIVMAEYQFTTGSTRYKKSLSRLNDLLKAHQVYANGTFGHSHKTSGYGPMSGISGLACLAWAMMEKANVKIHKKAYERTLITMDMELVRKDGDSPQGDYGYGWPNHGKKIYDFNAKAVPPSLNHLDVDLATFNDARAAGIPKGAMALTHSIRPWQAYSPLVARHHINKICRTRRCIVNGHGSGMLHGWMCFLALGYAANTGNPRPLRLALDANKDLLNAARCWDGSFYTQPQRDASGGDLHYGSRTLPTALWATVLSIPDAKLVMLGSESAGAVKKALESGLRLVKAKRYAAAAVQLEKAKALGSLEAEAQLTKIAPLAKEEEAHQKYLAIKKNHKVRGKEKTAVALQKLIAEYPETEVAKKATLVIKSLSISE